MFHYIYMNPYRANLCARTEAWPWFHCADTDLAWFKPNLEDNHPHPASLG